MEKSGVERTVAVFGAIVPAINRVLRKQKAISPEGAALRRLAEADEAFPDKARHPGNDSWREWGSRLLR